MQLGPLGSLGFFSFFSFFFLVFSVLSSFFSSPSFNSICSFSGVSPVFSTSSKRGMFDSLRSVLEPDLESDIIFRHVLEERWVLLELADALLVWRMRWPV